MGLQMTPSPPLRGSRCGQDSQQLSLETSMQQSPMSPLIGDSRAHSMPNPLPSPVPLRSPGPYSPAHSHQPRLDHHHHSPVSPSCLPVCQLSCIFQPGTRHCK